jgi:glutathione S-transferase
MLVLYGIPVSSYTAKVAVALEAKRIPYERRLPPGGSYRAPEYRALVPAGTIPALDHGGFVLSESDAIIEYLEETWPDPPLLPGDARQRARIRFLSRFHDLHVEPHLRALFKEADPRQRDPARAAAPLAAFRQKLELLEGYAEAAPYLAGEHFSLADCAWPTTLAIADRLLPPLGARLALSAKLQRWRRALFEHAAVAAIAGPYGATLDAWLDAQQPKGAG